MLILKRITRFNEYLRCGVSKEAIGYGSYYYEDNEDGLIIKATVYRNLKDKKILDEFDSTILNTATSEYEYAKQLRQMEREFLQTSIFDRKIAGKE